DAPDGAEQADEGSGRTDGGKHAGATQDPSPVACFDALEARRDSFLDAFVIGSTGGKPQLGRGRVEELRDLVLDFGKLLDVLECGAPAGDFAGRGSPPPLGEKDLN